MKWAFLLLLSAACGRAAGTDSEESPVTGTPIVVYWTIDTLGATAASTTDLCDDVTNIMAGHGRDVACLDGAISGSSWTLESHVRTLWPQHWSGDQQGNVKPSANQPSFLQTIAESYDAYYGFASDNHIFDSDATQGDNDPWFQGTTQSFISDEPILALPEAETPVRLGMAALLEETGTGAPAVQYFNDMMAGGHFPRCFMDPSTEACQYLWGIAVEHGLVPADADPAMAWPSLDQNLQEAAKQEYDADPAVLKEAFWATVLQGIDHFSPAQFEQRLDDLLTDLEAQGRLDDLQIVIAGDHGENPCFRAGDGFSVNCSHGMLPTEYTARVPFMVSPASIGEDWIAAGYVGAGADPWSLGNVAWGLLDAQGITPPDDWADMEPVGSASSWACSSGTGDLIGDGLRVVGDVSLRCTNYDCAAFGFGFPDDEYYEAEPLDFIPAELADFVVDEPGETWVSRVCAD